MHELALKPFSPHKVFAFRVIVVKAASLVAACTGNFMATIYNCSCGNVRENFIGPRPITESIRSPAIKQQRSNPGSPKFNGIINERNSTLTQDDGSPAPLFAFQELHHACCCLVHHAVQGATSAAHLSTSSDLYSRNLTLPFISTLHD